MKETTKRGERRGIRAQSPLERERDVKEGGDLRTEWKRQELEEENKREKGEEEERD